MTVVAIIGKPNTGKSTLFNRMISRREAVVNAEPNVTRDRHYGSYFHRERTFHIIDTGGIGEDSDIPFKQKVEQQVDIAINESDIVVFLLDNKSMPTPDDYYIADKLRKASKDIVIAANKCDNLEDTVNPDLYTLGLGDIIPISAEHKYNTDRLKDIIARKTPDREPVPREGIKIAVVGKPNVGKSSYINRIINSERMIVSEIPGTTRDSVDTAVRYNERDLILVDTAGIRRSASIKNPTEYYTVLRTKLAVRRADAVIVIIDINESVTRQDKRILSEVSGSLKPFVIAINKTDTVDSSRKEYIYSLIESDIEFTGSVPRYFISVTGRRNLTKVLNSAIELFEKLPVHFSKSRLNTLLFEIVSRRKHPVRKRKHIRFYSLKQVSDNPVIFIVYVSNPEYIDNDYKRYIINSIRKELGLEGLNIGVKFRSRH
ncbi:MAG: ribosome biogenesis GTPase Der [bacterium]